MTRQSFHQQLDELHAELVRMGAQVEEMIEQAVRALAQRDQTLSDQVIQFDDVIDNFMLDIEVRSLRLLALQQPMAVDLRTIATALKIVTDLERMADLAVDIAKVNRRIGEGPLFKPLVDIPRMAEMARRMVHESLDCYIKGDPELARQMIKRDDDVDAIYKSVHSELLELMERESRLVRQGTFLIFVAHSLERIADHATNIGEWVIYMVTGKREELNN